MGRSLGGKIALVTGGAAGLGLGMARAFLAEGARVVLLDIAAPPATLLATPAVMALACDVTDEAALETAFCQAEAAWGPLDIVVVNAGISQNSPSLALDFARWRQVMAINLDAAFLAAQAAGRRMVPRGRGVILFTASVYGVIAGPERLGYVVSKQGIVAMAKALALEWSPLGLRVNAIAPGYVRTALLDDLIARGRVDGEAIIAHTPLRRFISVEEVAKTAAFVVSDAASAITGHVIAVDGGWIANGFP